MDATQEVVAARTALPWLGMIAVPLAITAGLLSDQWWCVIPLAVCARWWAPRSWGWEWLAAVQMGVVGAGWAAVGAALLATAPDHRAAIAAGWVAAAAALAGTAAAARRGDRSR